MVDKDLILVLKAVGFDNKTARVYLALLEAGEASATEIARRAELKRPIVYYTLERLVSQGYAQRVVGSKVKKFAAIDPLRILRNAQQSTDELRFMIPLMQALHHKSGERPQIEYHDDRNAIISLYRAFDRVHNARFLSSTEHLLSFAPEEVEAWITRARKSKRHPYSRTLLTDSKKDREWAVRIAGTNEEARILPPSMRVEMDLAITDNVLAITSFDPLFTVVIHSDRIARTAALLYDLAWELGKEV